MDSEDDMHDANDVESLDDFYSGETAMASDDGDYEFNSDDSDDSTYRRQQQNYTILSEAEICQRQEDDIMTVSTVLSISRFNASILLRHFNWSVSKVHDAWFADEESVRKAVGLLEKLVVDPMPNARELTCGICFETYHRGMMNAAACGHQFCNICWKGYISTSINDGPGCLMLRCPDPSCGAAVGQGMIDKLASDEDKEKYSRYLLRSYVEDNKKTKWCPAPGCEFAVDFVMGGGNYDVCCNCSYNFCWNCTEEAHRPVDCITVAKWILKNSAESENMNWILANSKPCPKCKRPMLIFDDMWDDFPLDKVGIPHPSEENGCKIVLTTRDLRVCRAMGAHEVKLQVLSDEESWELFKKNAGDVVVSTAIEELAKAVTRECCHLPLAIITVGKAMCGVNDVRVWKNALKELQESNLEVKGMDDVFVQLKFSYIRLRNSELKSCFLYCSLYPEDHNISSKQLIEYWICEGIIDKRETRDDNMNKGHAILDELTKVSMLELVRGAGDYKVVRMHDLIRDMAIRITRMESPRSMINAGVQLKESPIEWPTDAVRISLMENDIKVLSGQPNCRSLLTLLLQRNPVDKIIPHSYFNHMCSLRVLDLSRTRIKALPESISNLKNLHALLLQGCEFLEDVPSLSNLEELRVLDLSFTPIRELPPGMEAMVKLQRLNLSWTQELRVFPIGIIPRLSFLEELTMRGSRWKWSSMTTEGAKIEEIANSTQLTDLEIEFADLSSFLYHVNSGNWQMMKNFRLHVGSSTSPYYVPNFSVEINSCDLIGEDNSLLLPYNTQWLHINTCEFISLWNVTRSLNTSDLCGCRLYSCEKTEFLMADDEPLLPDLKELTMDSMPELLALCKGIPSLDALKSLESLRVVDCHKLKYLLPARLLQQLRSLKHIDVTYCDGMEEIVVEEEEMGKGRNEDKSSVTMTLSQLQTLRIFNSPNLKIISSRVLICNALVTINIGLCRQLKKLPFCVHNLPSALKQIKVHTRDQEWWDTLEWDHPQTKAHFQSLLKFTDDVR